MSLEHSTVDRFLVAASVPREGSHRAGSLAECEALRTAHPEIATMGLYVSAVLGDAERVGECIAREPGAATRLGGPFGWDPLTYLCFSRYLRLDRSRAGGFLRSATLLLDAGADPNTGWREGPPHHSWEKVLYGAAAIAEDADVSRLLIARGADPNDEETPYHVPESYDLTVLRVLLESGGLTPDSLATMLLRKADVHDTAGMRLLLEHGADPNRRTRWGFTALEQALRRDNELEAITVLLDHGADPGLAGAPGGMGAVAIAAERGRGDVLRLLTERGAAVPLHGVHRLLELCARGDVEHARALVQSDHAVHSAFAAMQGQALAQFAGNGNVPGLRSLLAIGAPVDARHLHGDPYFEVAPASTALHVASWRARHEAVALLLGSGADPNAHDGAGRSALALAVRACVDSYWKARRSPASVALLLGAGSSRAGIEIPTGYDAVDELFLG